MLRNRVDEHANPRARTALCALLIVVCLLVQTNANPLPTSTTVYDRLLENATENSTLDNDLYVIKAVVYEIGILTDADNTTSDTTERQEEVKISLFDQPTGGNESSKQSIPALLFSSYNATL